MNSNVRIAVIGDYSASVTAHVAVAPALALAARTEDVEVEPVWVHTSKLTNEEAIASLSNFEGIWCVPSPRYTNSEGVISAITLARTKGIPFLGTCAGFQHALMEYFRNVIGVKDASSEELNPESEHLVISRLSCSLVEVSGRICLAPGSLASRLYGRDQVEEGYRCNYGFNSAYALYLENRTDLQIEGRDLEDGGGVRIFRLQEHPFFLATLFQPERSSLKGLVHPLIRAFVSASAHRAAGESNQSPRTGGAVA